MDVSIVIPVNGDAPFLNETIKSIELQITNNIDVETIIILDRPSTLAKTLCTDTASKLKNFTVIESLMPGIVPALNLGISKARGRYIARLDSDDRMHPSRIRIQYTELEKYVDLFCVGTQVRLIDEYGKSIGVSHYPTNERDIARVLPFRNCIAHPSVMFRRDIFEKVEGYKSKFQGCEDYELWLRIFNGANIKNLNSTLTDYRVWPNQVTQKDKNQIAHQLMNLRSENLSKRVQEESIQFFRIQVKLQKWSQYQIDACFDVLKFDIGIKKYLLFFLHFFGALLSNPIQIALFSFSFIKSRFH